MLQPFTEISHVSIIKEWTDDGLPCRRVAFVAAQPGQKECRWYADLWHSPLADGAVRYWGDSQDARRDLLALINEAVDQENGRDEEEAPYVVPRET